MNNFRSWWSAEPWRIFGKTRWKYYRIYKHYRQGSWWEQEQRWLLKPKGIIPSIWGVITFPHVHEYYDDDDYSDPPPVF